MKNLKNFIFFIILFSIFLSSSCRKTGNPTAIITVVDTNNNPLEGANVHIFADDPESIIDENGTTSADGTVRFEFKEPAVLIADAYYAFEMPSDTNNSILIKDTLYGRKVIKLDKERHKENITEETITVK